MRSFAAADWRASQAAWMAGRFGPRWNPIRSLAAANGYIYPPSGSVDDDRNTAEPSQRSIVFAALCDRPAEVEAIVARSSSWREVVAAVLAMEARLEGEVAPDPGPPAPRIGDGFAPLAELLKFIAGEPVGPGTERPA
jgi:hypothetical protein